MGRRLELAAIALLALALPMPASANFSVPTDAVPSEYTPIDSLRVAESLSISSFNFEANPETRRARVVVEHTYPDSLIYITRNRSRGPHSNVAQHRDLWYSPADNEIVNSSNGSKTAGVKAADRTGLCGHHEKIIYTGARSVTARVENPADCDGWDIRRFCTLD